MTTCFNTETAEQTLPIRFFTSDAFSRWIQSEDADTFARHWAASTDYTAASGSVRLVPDTQGQLKEVWCGISASKDAFWQAGQLPLTLPEGNYHFHFDALGSAITPEWFALAFGLGSYQFDHYRHTTRSPACLSLDTAMRTKIQPLVEAIFQVRDLINLPAEDMGPSQLAEAVHRVAKSFGADVEEWAGDALLKAGFSAIHTVGRASDDPPRLLDLQWGDMAHPKVTLVGKGVCFDSGGLDIKPASAMQLMKKDMGGAAHVLGLAQMIMAFQLPLRLRVLIPAVENAISGNAYRPGDVITMRSGKTVEVGNTDAEGRLILADALTEATTAEQPDLLIDIATLTGAARVAVGTEIAAFFCEDAALSTALMHEGEAVSDPLWPLPLHAPYREGLNSPIADINSTGSDSYAGASMAALFLKEFVPAGIPWIHFDLMAWNIRSRPGRPVGGEAMGIRALFSYLCKRFG